MYSHGIVSKLAEQLVHATGRASEERAKGLEAAVQMSIIRSLRMTLASIVQLRDLRDVGTKGFLCLIDQAGEPVVKHAGRILPVAAPYLRHLFEEAGVALAPGQAILLDAALARHIVEEALAVIGREEAGVRDQKSKLVAAYLAADALDQGRTCPAGRLPSEAA